MTHKSKFIIAEVTQKAEGRFLFTRLTTDAFKIKAEKRILRKETGACSSDGEYFMRKPQFLSLALDPDHGTVDLVELRYGQAPLMVSEAGVPMGEILLEKQLPMWPLARRGLTEVIMDAINSWKWDADVGDDSSILKELIDPTDLPADQADRPQPTPIRSAALVGDIFVAKIVLVHGAGLKAKDRWGDQALVPVQANGRSEFVLVLSEARAPVSRQQIWLNKLFFVAVEYGKIVSIVSGVMLRAALVYFLDTITATEEGGAIQGKRKERASGNVGKPTVDALLEAGGFRVTALTRKGSTASFPERVTAWEIDDSYPQDELHTVFSKRGSDAVICLLPPVDVNLLNMIADVAAQAGVKRFIPSEFGSDTDAPKVVQLIPMFGGKVAVTNHLKTKVSFGMTWTSVVNGAFFDWGLRTGFLGFDLQSSTATIYDSGDAEVNATTLADVGQAVVGILRHPKETANRYVYVQNAYFTQNQLLAAIEKSTGKKWTVNKRECAEARQTGGMKLSKGDMSGIPDIILGGLYTGEPAANYAKTRKLDNELLGIKEYPLEELVDKVIKGQ
ncbi:MAG: hypothetical protein Q9210_005186, partial [Variospora velana]